MHKTVSVQFDAVLYFSLISSGNSGAVQLVCVLQIYVEKLTYLLVGVCPLQLVMFEFGDCNYALNVVMDVMLSGFNVLVFRSVFTF